jgi:hypothetical protein
MADFVVLSIETTGVEMDDEIISLMLMRPDKSVIYQSYLAPRHHSSVALSTQYNGITDDMLLGKPVFGPKTGQCLLNVVKDGVILLWGNKFNVTMFGYNGIVLPKTVDVQKLIAPVIGLPLPSDPGNRFKLPTWQDAANAFDLTVPTLPEEKGRFIIDAYRQAYARVGKDKFTEFCRLAYWDPSKEIR